MNLAHLHLLLNHFPNVGLGIALGLLLAALLKKSEDLKQASLVAFFLLGLVAIPAYLTGSAAQVVLEDQPNVSQQVMAAHKDAALLALILMEITGLVAWIALWRFRRLHQTAVLVLAIVTFGLLGARNSIFLSASYLRSEPIAGSGDPLPPGLAGANDNTQYGANIVFNHQLTPLISMGANLSWSRTVPNAPILLPG